MKVWDDEFPQFLVCFFFYYYNAAKIQSKKEKKKEKKGKGAIKKKKKKKKKTRTWACDIKETYSRFLTLTYSRPGCSEHVGMPRNVSKAVLFDVPYFHLFSAHLIHDI